MAVARIIAGLLSVSCVVVAASVAPCNPTDGTCDAAQTQILLQRDSTRSSEDAELSIDSKLTEAFRYASVGSDRCPSGFEPATREQCAAAPIPGTTFNGYSVCHSHWPSGCFQNKNQLYFSPCSNRALSTENHLGVCVVAKEACKDSVADWQDSGTVGCADYARQNYCTAGKVGSAWQQKWGPFEDYQKNGKHAGQVCCVCGGGIKAVNTVNPCKDFAHWKDHEGGTCADYVSGKWCTSDGKEGEGWKKDWGTIKGDWKDKDGLDATQVCCGCGGGDQALWISNPGAQDDDRGGTGFYPR